MESFGTPTTIASVVISMLATANVVQWKEIKRLNNLRADDAKDTSNKTVTALLGMTRALDNLRRKITGVK